MVNIDVSKVIHRPAADVFSFVANFENRPKWETDFLVVKQIIATPEGIGATYQCLLQFPGQTQTVTSKFVITEYELNHKIAFVGEPTRPAPPKGSYLFDATDDRTKITSQPRSLRSYYRKVSLSSKAFLNVISPLISG